jgi:hypothetical protein
VQRSMAEAARRSGRALCSVQAVCVQGCVQLLMAVTSCGPAGEGPLLLALPRDIVAGITGMVLQLQQVLSGEVQEVVVQVGVQVCCAKLGPWSDYWIVGAGASVTQRWLITGAAWAGSRCMSPAIILLAFRTSGE